MPQLLASLVIFACILFCSLSSPIISGGFRSGSLEEARVLDECTESVSQLADENLTIRQTWHKKCDWLIKVHKQNGLLLGDYQPAEIHLQWPGNSTQMEFIWVTHKSYQTLPNLQISAGNTCNNNPVNSVGISESCPTIGHFPYSCTQYSVLVNNLVPSTQYGYKVGNAQLKQWSDCYTFTTAPQPALVLSNPFSLVIYGDMGILPGGHKVTSWILTDHQISPFSMLLHIGDIAYAGVGSIQEGEMEFLWDEYMNQIQALATLMPYQVTVGNHEKYYNYTAFQFRFHMPKSNAFPSNFWYSMQWGSAYVIVISTEHDYTNGSEQFRFIEQELQKANDLKGRSVEWIIISGHRPFYCSDADELSQHTPGSPLLNTFEELFIKNRVDLVLGGHMHVYERAGPVFNGTQIAPPTIPNTYTNSPWPLYLTQGTGGIAVGEDKFINPSPEWSVVRYTHFGFGRLTFQEKDGNALLIYEYKANGNPTPLDSVTLVHTH